MRPAPAGRPALRVLAVLVLLLLLAGLAGPRAAFAHAGLVSSEPADGAVLEAAPAAITLRFNEPVRPLVARLIGPDGRTVLLGVPQTAGDGALVLALPAGLARGTHVLSWRVTSDDGHPVAGGQSFSVGAPSLIGVAAVPAADPVVRAGLWLARLVLAGSLVFGVGSVAFLALSAGAPGRGLRRGLAGLLAAGALAGIAVIGFQGLDALGEPLAALLRPDVWMAGLGATAFGRATLIAVAALLPAAIALGADLGPRTRTGVALLALGAAAASFAAAGHAASAPPRGLMAPAVLVHAACVLLWLGAFLPLLDALAHPGVAVARALATFSRLILPVTAWLVASGVFLADVQLVRLDALWTTAYGAVLLAKLALVALLFGLAALNRFRLTAPALAGRPRALARSVRAELVLAVAILGVAGLWRFTPPPRLIAAAAPPVHSVIARRDGIEARLTLSPATVGPASVTVDGLRRDGQPFRPLKVEVELGKPAYGLGPFSHAATLQGDAFVAPGFVLPMDGFWVVTVSVLVDDFRSVDLVDLFAVEPAKKAF